MGQIFLDRIQIIGLEYEHALQDIRNAISDQDATISIGAGPIWTCAVLPTVAARFHALYPRHRLIVSTGSVETLGEDLRLGRIDIFAGALLPSTTPKGFAVKNLARTDMVVLASEEHDLVKTNDIISPARLADHPFVVFQPSRGVIEGLSSYLRLNNAPPPRILVETGSIYACIELVRTGKYLLYENRMIAQSRIGSGVAIVTVGEPIQPFDIGIVHREGLDRLPHLNRLIRIMAQVLGETLVDPDGNSAPHHNLK